MAEIERDKIVWLSYDGAGMLFILLGGYNLGGGRREMADGV